MSRAQTDTSNESVDLSSWALAMLARGADQTVIAPPSHDRLDHLAESLGFGEAGRTYLALFYGLWRGAGSHRPVSAAQARRAAGAVPAGLRSLLVYWQVLNETAVSPGAPLALVLDETIGDWLEGGDPIPPRWRDRISGRQAHEPLPDWPIEKLASAAEAAFASPSPHPLVITLSGVEGSGRRSLAATLGNLLGIPPIFSDLRGLGQDEATGLMKVVERMALLTLRAPAYLGGEGLTLPEDHPAFALQFVIADADGDGLRRDGQQRRAKLGPLDHTTRAEAWERLCPQFSDWPEADCARLVAMKPATIGEIAATASESPANADQAMGLIRERQLARLDPTIQPHRGTLGWDDIVLPDRVLNSLQRLADEIAHTAALWDSETVARLYPQGRGVFSLFSGYSGTGKTMAAQVIARSLGVDLYVVDSGAVVSKYVGETAQNLQSILRQAEHDAALLFFDEADGLFGKRTETRDSHARYLNAETNVLLRAVESYTGACILATNRRDNIDSAFLRRLRYAVEFPQPDAALRLRLWSRLAEGLSPESATDLKLVCGRLAETLDFTGAQIKNALRTALIESRRAGRHALTPSDLLAGADQELMKEGRALTPAEAARLEGSNGKA